MLRDIVIDGDSNDQEFLQSPTGILLFYDNSRSKYLSVSRESISFGINHKNISNKMWLLLTSSIPSKVTGYKLVRNATITSITIQSYSIITDCTFHIVKNNNTNNIISINVSNSESYKIDNLNIDVNSGDWIQTIIDPNIGNVDYPLIMIEYSWR